MPQPGRKLITGFSNPTVKHLREADMANNQNAVALDALVDYLIDQVAGGDEHDHGHLHAGHIHTHH